MEYISIFISLKKKTREIARISIIVPCYNEQEAIPFFHKEITLVLKEIGEDYELLFVNDGSKDDTLKRIPM